MSSDIRVFLERSIFPDLRQMEANLTQDFISSCWVRTMERTWSIRCQSSTLCWHPCWKVTMWAWLKYCDQSDLDTNFTHKIISFPKTTYMYKHTCITLFLTSASSLFLLLLLPFLPSFSSPSSSSLHPPFLLPSSSLSLGMVNGEVMSQHCDKQSMHTPTVIVKHAPLPPHT